MEWGGRRRKRGDEEREAKQMRQNISNLNLGIWGFILPFF
jgi:hypothetical protein